MRPGGTARAHHVGDVYLDCRQRDGLERVKYGDAGVRVCRGIYYYAVFHTVGFLYFVYDSALVVRLEELGLDAALLCASSMNFSSSANVARP